MSFLFDDNSNNFQEVSNVSTDSSWNLILEKTKPNPSFKQDWSSYSSNDFATTFLPQIAKQSVRGLSLFDGVDLFSGIGLETSESLWSPNGLEIELVLFTFPNTSIASKMKTNVRPLTNEIHVYIDVDQRGTLLISSFLGAEANIFFRGLVDAQLSSKIIKTHITSLKSSFGHRATSRDVLYYFFGFALEAIPVSEVFKPGSNSILSVFNALKEIFVFPRNNLAERDESNINGILIGGEKHIFSQQVADELEEFGEKIYLSMLESASIYVFQTELELVEHIVRESSFRDKLVETINWCSDNEVCNFSRVIGTNASGWEFVPVYYESNEGEMIEIKSYGLRLVDDPDILPSNALLALFENRSSYFDCGTMIMTSVYKAIHDTLGSTKFNELYGGEKRNNLIIGPEWIYLKDKDSDIFEMHPLLRDGVLETVEIMELEKLLRGDWVYLYNAIAYQIFVPRGAYSGEHTVYNGFKNEEHLFTGFPLGQKSKESWLQALTEEVLKIEIYYLSMIKALEVWFPEFTPRLELYEIFFGSRFWKYQNVKKGIDGYRIIVDRNLIQDMLSKTSVTIQSVTVPFSELSLEEGVYYELDFEDLTMEGKLPGIGKKNILRPRLDRL